MRKITNFLVLFIATLNTVQASNKNANDQTSCMTDFEEDDELHFLCFCNDNYQSEVLKHAEIISQHPGFSLAHFAYNLAGSYFGKSVHVTFQECRHLKLILDHMELSRIGSDFFRPDIQVRGLRIRQVYHLELARKPPKTEPTELPDEYLIAFPSESLVIDLASVALAKIDAGAQFSSLQTASRDTRLYIDLNNGQVGDEDNLNILGFDHQRIYFITNTQRVRLQEGENMRVKMKELALSMSPSPRTHELSFALVTFAVVIFLGIIGLFVVVVHRQKRKRQLKALLRAKNLGPILESREIAQNTGMKHYPQYVHIKKYESRGQTPNPDIEALPTISKEDLEDDKKKMKLDINDFLAGIMVRMRRNDAKITSTRNLPSPTQETSFYYKESSLSSKGSVKNTDVAVQVHQADSASSSSEAGNSYASRISQQVFVKGGKNHAIKSKFASFFSSVYKSNTKL